MVWLLTVWFLVIITLTLAEGAKFEGNKRMHVCAPNHSTETETSACFVRCSSCRPDKAGWPGRQHTSDLFTPLIPPLPPPNLTLHFPSLCCLPGMWLFHMDEERSWRKQQDRRRTCYMLHLLQTFPEYIVLALSLNSRFICSVLFLERLFFLFQRSENTCSRLEI